MTARPYDDIVLVAPVTVPYVRFSIRGAHWFIGRALAGLVEAAGIEKGEIDGLCLSSFTLGADTAIGLTQHLGLTVNWLDHIPFGGASGVLAVRRAARAVEAGDAEIVACIAGDTNDTDSFRQGAAAFSQFGMDAVYPMGAGGPNQSFAFLTDHYSRIYDARREDFGRLCVDQRTNALSNPNALFRTPLSLDAYMAARPIADPIHLFDCVMPCAGADAFLVMRGERAAGLGLGTARLLGAAERHNEFPGDMIQWRGGWAANRDALYDQAGIGPDDIDLVNTYDDYPVMSFIQLEDLGFCEKGGAADLIRKNTMVADGSFPVNTSGGQLSVGQAGCAGGYLGLVEAIRQVTGAPEGTAVPNARHALASGFGMVTYDRGLCSGAVILAGDGGQA